MRRTVTAIHLLALALGAGLALAGVAPTHATTVVPVADADLIDHAASIVVGRITAIQSHWDPARGQVFTDITLSLDEVLAGPALPATITIRQPGGHVGGLHSWIDGSPEFDVGEKALLFLRVATDGTLRVAHLHQGKFRIMVEPETGGEIGVRVRDGQVRVLPPQRAGAAPQDGRALEDLRRTIRNRAAHRPARQFLGVTAPAPPSGPVHQTQAFSFNGSPARWYEPDSGQPVAMSINVNGEPRAPSGGFDQVRAAMKAWNDSGSAFRFAEGALTTAAGSVFDGVNSIAFGDPTGQMDPPVNCSGTLAQGGFFRSVSDQRVVNGQAFWRVLEGDIVINDGWQGCGFYEVFANLTEVATHELGHVLGLGHSSDPDATMYAVAHFDGRGSSLRADDRAGLRFIYPVSPRVTVTLAGSGSGTVTSSPAGITCPSDCSETYVAGTSVTLSATPASGSTFGGWSGGCSGAGACRVTLSAALAVTARFDTTALGLTFATPPSGATVSGTTQVSLTASGGSGYSYQVRLDGSPIFAGTSAGFAWDTTTVTNGPHTLSATVTDSTGRTATRSIPVTVSNAAGGLRVALTQPANGATVSGEAWAVVWVEGATGASNTFTLSLGGRAMGNTTSGSRGPVSIRYDSRTVADGAQPLTATVRDAAGATGSSTITVNVANGGAPPAAPPPPSPPSGSLRVHITQPSSGGIVRGTAWVTLWLDGSSGSNNSYTLSAAGATVATTTTSSTGPVTLAWVTTGTPDGARTLTASVRDATGNTGATSIPVTVANGGGPAPTPAPLGASFTSPASGATVAGTVTVGMASSGASGSATYTLTVDGATASTQTTASGSASFAWSTTQLADGAHTLGLTVTDGAGRTATATRSVTVRNAAPPPTSGTLRVFVTSPTAGSTVSGVVWVNVWVEGSSGGSHVYTLTVNGVTVATETSSAVHVTPAWDSRATGNGTRTLTATVRDAAGNTGSVSVTVTVSN